MLEKNIIQFHSGEYIDITSKCSIVTNKIPQCPESLPLIVFAVKGRNNSDNSLKARRKMMHLLDLNKTIYYIKKKL